MKTSIITIGRTEKIYLPGTVTKPVAAKVDTGAGLSSIWATKIREENSSLYFRLFGPSSPHYTGKDIHIPKGQFSRTRIRNSFGHREQRYVVKMKVKIAGRVINGTFTLANRSRQLYPILLGRRLLKGKFVVDVTKGTPLLAAEQKRRAKLKAELHNSNGKPGA